MIKFNNISQEVPYIHFKKKYDDALNKNQKNIEAMSISSFIKENNEVDSRYVNCKIIDEKNFIFFSNYNSSKAEQFNSNKNIAALFFWNNINTQIRIKAQIFKLDELFSDRYFKNRQKEKNALAISSRQSKPINSFDLVKENYLDTLESANLEKRPKYWGGYRLVPYEFEFWIGHKHRLNQRTLFKTVDGEWNRKLLQP